MLSNTLDVVVMKGHASVIGSHTDLWTMTLSAGVLVLLLMLACAGTAAVDAAGVGIRLELRGRMNARECEQTLGDLEKSLIFGGLTTI